MKILKYIFFILIFVELSFAAPDVNKRVDEMFNRIKKEKSFAVMLDYVHWDSAYGSLGEEERLALGVTSADAYKAKVGSFIKNPSEAIKKEMEKQMGAQQLPPEQKQMIASMIDSQVKQVEAQMQKEVQEVSNSTYKILSTDVQGNKANVKVELTKPSGEVKTDNMNFELIDDQWYIPTSEIGQNGSIVPMSK